ncbi:MAG: endopeptidase La, partial [Lachnospiraceae bacterium]|nr:endopeptidase La [Lachnospiraceae bacterium]
MTVIPIYHMLVAPDATTYFQTSRYRTLTGKPAKENEKVVFVVTKENQNRLALSDDSFYPIGLSGVITEVNPNGFLAIRTGSRVHIDEVHVNMDHSIELVMSRMQDIEDIDPADEQARFITMKQALEEFSSHFEWASMAEAYLSQWHSIADVACAFSFWMSISHEERYDILAVDSKKKRIELMEKAIYQYIEIAKVTNDAENAQKADYQNIYKEQAIKKQMEYLQKELDEMHPENVSDLRKMELAIEDSMMNDEAREEATKVLNRLKQEGSNSHEYGMLYDYLDFLTSLSWKKEDVTFPSLTEAEKILDEDHFGLKKIKRRIIEQLAVMSLNHRQSGSILLFVG